MQCLSVAGTHTLRSRRAPFLVNTLTHVNGQAVYHMPTTEDETPEKSIPLALQSLFYKVAPPPPPRPPAAHQMAASFGQHIPMSKALAASTAACLKIFP